MTMAAASTGLSAAGSLLQGVGGYKAGKFNAQQLEQAALQAERDGVAEVAAVRSSARAAIGQQVAAQFSNGFEGGSGSALDALTESQINAALDALTVRRQAQAKAQSLRAQGALARMQGRNALLQGMFGAGSTIIAQRADWAAARRGLTPASASMAPQARPSGGSQAPMSEGGAQGSAGIRWSPPATRGI